MGRIDRIDRHTSFCIFNARPLERVCSNNMDVHMDVRATLTLIRGSDTRRRKKENRTNNNTLALKRARGEHAPLLPETVHLGDIDARHRIDK